MNEQEVLEMKEKVQQSTIENISLIMKYTQEFSERYPPSDIMSDKKEFCTYKVYFPRRFGNTTLALKLMQKYENALYFTYRADLAKIAYKEYLQKYNLQDSQDLKDRFKSYKQINAIYGRNFYGKIIIIDIACMISPNELNSLYATNGDFYILIE